MIKLSSSYTIRSVKVQISQKDVDLVMA